MEEKFLLVSLDEEKSKKLAQVISNETARKILNLLSSKKMSETDVAKEMNMPISTVHYNIQALVKNGLVEAKDFFWSDKGNKILMYEVARKTIVIAPKGSNFLNELKKIIPVGLVSVFVGGILYYGSQFFTQGFGAVSKMSSPMLESAGNEMLRATPAMIKSTCDAGIKTSSGTGNFVWFLAGACAVVLVYLIFSFFRRRK